MTARQVAAYDQWKGLVDDVHGLARRAVEWLSALGPEDSGGGGVAMALGIVSFDCLVSQDILESGELPMEQRRGWIALVINEAERMGRVLHAERPFEPPV